MFVVFMKCRVINYRGLFMQLITHLLPSEHALCCLDDNVSAVHLTFTLCSLELAAGVTPFSGLWHHHSLFCPLRNNNTNLFFVVVEEQDSLLQRRGSSVACYFKQFYSAGLEAVLAIAKPVTGT